MRMTSSASQSFFFLKKKQKIWREEWVFSCIFNFYFYRSIKLFTYVEGMLCYVYVCMILIQRQERRNSLFDWNFLL